VILPGSRPLCVGVCASHHGLGFLRWQGRIGRGGPATVAHYGQEDRSLGGSLGVEGSERQEEWDPLVNATSEGLGEWKEAELDSGGDRVLSFGKHKGLTYQEALSADEAYCNYWARQLGLSGAEDMMPAMVEEFAQWLRERGLPTATKNSPPRTLGFGEHCNMTYEEARSLEPDYRIWIIQEKRSGGGDDPRLKSFVSWLERQYLPRVGDGQRIMGFGKHNGLSFEEVRSQDPEYCEWLLKSSQNKSGLNMQMAEFASWLQEEGLPGAGGGRPISGSLVGFGKYRDLTYEEARSVDPTYCSWVVQHLSGSADTHRQMSEFAQWLQVIDFGPHRGLTFEEVLSQHPDYCAKVAHRGQQGEALERLSVFFRWLQAQRPASAGDAGLRSVGFGTHGDLTYEQVRSREPDYCRWVMEKAKLKTAEVHKPMEELAQWLQQQQQQRAGVSQRTLDAGYHRGLTFEEVRSKHPEYCAMVIKYQRGEEVRPRMKEFCRWLLDQGPTEQG